MKEKIITYIKENGPVSVNTIASALGMDGLPCLRIIDTLMKMHFLKMCTPVALTLHNNCSCYYTVI